MNPKIDSNRKDAIFYLYMQHGVHESSIVFTVSNTLEGSARPEVRGTAEPHGGAYPP